MEFSVRGKIGAFRCQNCGAIMGVSDICPLSEKDILERVSPGEPMPYGECPCGALVHPLELTNTAHHAARRILRALETQCGSRSMDDDEDRVVTAAILAKTLEVLL